jgi:predicted kinase
MANTAARLFILCGLPYAGKTTLHQELETRTGAGAQVVWVDSIMSERNMWREGHPTQQDKEEALSEAYRRVGIHLQDGKTVLLDSTFLSFSEREFARNFANGVGVKHHLIYVNTPKEEILKRRQQNEITKTRGQVSVASMEKAFTLFEEPKEHEQPILYNANMNLDDWIQQNFPLKKSTL